jgi:hypothetical protein
MTLASKTHDYLFRQNKILGGFVVLSLCVSLFCAIALVVQAGDPSLVAMFLVSLFFFLSFADQTERDLMGIGAAFAGLVHAPARSLPGLILSFFSRSTTPPSPPPRTTVLV